MPTYLRRVFTSLPIILMAFIAGNEQLSAQSIFEGCAKDLETYCSPVSKAYAARRHARRTTRRVVRRTTRRVNRRHSLPSGCA